MEDCSDCLFSDVCDRDGLCECYEPVSGFKQILEEYEEDLCLRAEEYQKLIKEQNS